MATAYFCILHNQAKGLSVWEELHRLGISEGDLSLCYIEGDVSLSNNEPSLAKTEGYTPIQPGRLIATGHFEWGLKGATTAPATGKIMRILAAMGMPTEEAKAYENWVRNGRVLLSAFCHDTVVANRVKLALQKCGAEQIASIGKSRERSAETIHS